MDLQVTYLGKTQAVELAGTTAEQLLLQLKVNRETVLVARNGTIVPETETLQSGDRIELIRTISGG